MKKEMINKKVPNLINEIKDIVFKKIEEEGFEYHSRVCEQTSHYGTVNEDGVFIPRTELVREEWNNKEFVNWLFNIDEINKLT